MKIRILVSLLVLTLSYFLFSCKEGGGARRSALPPVSGSTNELLVVMPKTLWEGHVGDTIKEFFGQPQLGLPQGEPVFDLINLPPSNFEKNVRFHRNILTRLRIKSIRLQSCFTRVPGLVLRRFFKSVHRM